MQARHWRGVATLAAVTALLAAFAGGAQARTDGGSGATAAAPYKVGIVYSRTGLLAAYGAEYIQGLRYGLAYATKGTMKVNGRPIELTVVDDGTDPTKAVAAGRDLIGKGYKILAGSVSSGVALQMAPLAAQNQVLFISGPAATDAVTGDQQVHVPLGPPDLPGRQDRGDLPEGRRQEGDRLRAGLRLRRRQLRGRQLDRRLAGPQRRPAARAAVGAGLHALRAAGEAGEPGPALRRLGGNDRARDVARARAAGRLRRLEQDHDRPRRAGDVDDLRRRRGEDRLPLALRLHGAAEQGQRLPRQVDAEARPGCRTCSRRTASSPAR